MEPCRVCGDVAERSDLYERWLFAENFGDGATLASVAAGHGYCTLHAARVVRRDPAIAGPIARFTLRVMEAELQRQLSDRRGYRDALELRARCPWCKTESEALEYALWGKRDASGPLCQAHAQDASQLRAQRLHIRSPLMPGIPLARPDHAKAADPAPVPPWWSLAVDELFASLYSGCCPACEAAAQASERREEFYRAGSRPHEHWETPRLCRLHDAQLDQPRDQDFRREPDGLDRFCDWCSVMERAAARTAELFAIAYGSAPFRLAYASAAGLCLPHTGAALYSLAGPLKHELAAAAQTRIATMIWELDERAVRRSWHLRDQGEPPNAATLSHRAWWLISGGTFRYVRD